MTPSSSDAQLFARVLTRITTAPADDVRSQVDGTLAAIHAQHAFGTEQVRRGWEHVLFTCVNDALGVAVARSDGAARAGERAANSGWLLSDCLEALQQMRSLAMNALRAQAIAEGHGQDVVIAGFQRIAESMTQYLLDFSSGYFEAEVAGQQRLRSQQDAFVWSVLTGSMDLGDSYNRLGAYGLDSAAQYFAFRAAAPTDTDFDELGPILGAQAHGSHRVGVATVIDGDVCGFMLAPPAYDGPRVIGISGPVSITNLPLAFRRASRAYSVASTAGLTGVHSLDDLGIIAAVVSDHDIAGVLDTKYLAPLRELGEYGKSLIATVRCFLDNDCQVDATAREMQMHENSVRYRITKFEDIVGVSLRDTARIAEIWWALMMPAVPAKAADDLLSA